MGWFRVSTDFLYLGFSLILYTVLPKQTIAELDPTKMDFVWSLFGYSASGQRLIDAAGAGDLASLQAVLESAVSTSVMNYRGHSSTANLKSMYALTALHHAVLIKGRMGQRGQLSTAESGSGSGPDFNACIQLLLARKADPDLTHANAPFRPLAIAAADGDTDIVQLLLDAGAEVDFQGTSRGKEQTALMRAVDLGRVSVVQLLLERGADRDSISYTCLDWVGGGRGVPGEACRRVECQKTAKDLARERNREGDDRKEIWRMMEGEKKLSS